LNDKRVERAVLMVGTQAERPLSLGEPTLAGTASSDAQAPIVFSNGSRATARW
jgi:hypothetical protein